MWPQVQSLKFAVSFLFKNIEIVPLQKWIFASLNVLFLPYSKFAVQSFTALRKGCSIGSQKYPNYKKNHFLMLLIL